MINSKFIFASLLILSFPLTATAYIGPGAGLSLVGALWALILALVTALVFVLVFPIRLLLRKQRKAKLESYKKDSSEDIDADTVDTEEPAYRADKTVFIKPRNYQQSRNKESHQS